MEMLGLLVLSPYFRSMGNFAPVGQGFAKTETVTGEAFPAVVFWAQNEFPLRL